MGSSVTRFPSGGAYVEALQNTVLCFDEPDLKGARVELDRLSRPKPISGNFASVFAVTADSGRRYAVKCFTREVADQELRYRAISDHLAPLGHRWKVGFDYLSQGIMVEGRRYPVLKMEWVEATSLTRWIDQHIHDHVALVGIADRFAELVAELASAGVAHGDLQHGNLLVAGDGSLRLVDYDGMYVPALAGIPAAEMGHRNYQSPSRSQSDFNPEVDRFSAWVIYLSLVAVAAEPTLWGQLHEEGGEYLLLAEDDFTHPAASSRFSVLLNHVVPQVRGLVEHVHALVGTPANMLPELRPIPLDSLWSQVVHGIASSDQPTVSGLPAWMADHVPDAEPLRVQGFAGRGAAVAVAMTSLGVLLLGTLALALFGFTPLSQASGLAVGGGALWFGGMTVLYLLRAERRTARRSRARRDLTVREHLAAVRELDAVGQGKAELVDAAMRRTHSERIQRQGVQARYGSQLAVVDHELALHLATVVTERNAYVAQQRRELDRALLAAQSAHVRSRLEKIRISSSGVEGIGDKLIGSLFDANIVTAADFAGVTYVANGTYQNRTALFRLPSGFYVRVPGIGEVKAGRLEDWRQQHERTARGSQPSSLPDGQRQVIEARFASQLRQVDKEEQQARAVAQQQKASLNQQLNADLATVAGEQRAAGTLAARQQVRQEHLLSRCQADVAVAKRARVVAAREADAYRRTTYLRFLLFACGSRN